MNDINITKDEITLKELIVNFIKILAFLKKQLIKLIIVGLIGGIFGFIYASREPVKYIAKTIFILEDSKNGGSNFGGLASLAGQFGVDVSGGAGGGMFTGDNILLYFKSSSLAKEVLLSVYDSSKKTTIADEYSEIYNLTSQWEKINNIGRVKFPPISLETKYSRLKDSLLQTIISDINSTKVNVQRVDKKSGFIEVSVKMINEDIAKIYCERLVQIAVEKYLNVKTKRQKATVEKLQARVDSIALVLNQKTYTNAHLQTNMSTMDINPMYKTQSTVASEKNIRDKNLLTNIFVTVSQNLELAKLDRKSVV